ncbi:hypothetical protein [Krasilnikovia sp. MM14-A1259]|uniref:hypothetical protein n=1 Tax=Krasilnikovia sp. MM14-A1259 TaxID=3373539 RepID=UPI003808BBCE
MDEPQDLDWFADDADRYPRGLGAILGLGLAFEAPLLLLDCARGSRMSLAALLVAPVTYFLFAAATLTFWQYDTRSVVRVRLVPAARPSEIEVSRANGTSAVYPVSALRKIDVERASGHAGAYHKMKFHFADHVERTRSGRADNQDRWADALTILEIPLAVRDRYED